MLKSSRAFLLCMILPVMGLCAETSFAQRQQLRVVSASLGPSNYVADFIEYDLKVKMLEKVDLTYSLKERIKELDLSDPAVLMKLYSEFFSELSADIIAESAGAFARPSYPNVLVTGPAGVGKTHLIQQFAMLYSFGLMPEYLRERLNLVDPDSPFHTVADAFFGKTQVVVVNKYLLRHNMPQKRKEPSLSAVERMNSTLEALFDQAKREFQRTDRRGMRTLFIFEEVATFPPEIQESLKTILDEGGFQTGKAEHYRKRDPGYHVIAFTTDAERREMSKGDAAIERRYLPLRLLEPGDEEVFGIVRHAATDWGSELGDITIDDASLRFLIKSKEFLNWPPLAAPSSVLLATADLIAWKMRNPGDNAREISIGDTQKFLIKRARLTDLWFEGPNGEPPFHDLEERLLKRVIGQDAVVKDIAQTLKTWVRFGLGQYVPIFILGGPTGSGKDTIVKAINMELFGHDGRELMFNIGGARGYSIDAIINGPPLGNHSDEEPCDLQKGLDQGKGTGCVAFNEAYDTPTSELEKLKVLIEKGAITPKGVDSRERPLRFPLFIMGQFNEDFFTDRNYQTAMQNYQALSQAEIEAMFLAGKPGKKESIGALTRPLLDRAKKHGGVYFMAPVDPDTFDHVIHTFLPDVIRNLETSKNMELVVDASLVILAAKISRHLAGGPRALTGITHDVILRAMSRAVDEGFYPYGAKISISSEEIGGSPHVVINDFVANRTHTFAAGTLIRGQNKCENVFGFGS